MDIDAFRQEIVARKRHAALVRQRFEDFDRWWSEHPDQDVVTAELRCDVTGPGHRNGRRPVLAKVYLTDRFGLLFSSRIEYVPSDQLNLRPWQRETIVSTADPDQPADVLTHWQNDLDEHGTGLGEHQGERWLKRMPAFHIREVLDLDAAELGRPQLWLRC